MRKEILAVDMDFVLMDLNKKWLEYYNILFGDNLTPDKITSWDIHDAVKPNAIGAVKNILKLKGFYRDLEVVPNSQRVLYELSKKFDIVIATDPYVKSSIEDKFDSLVEHFSFIPTKNFIFTGNKATVNADYLIDDGVHNLEVFKGTPILYSAPHNIKEDRYFRVHDWIDIEYVFLKDKMDMTEFYNTRGKSETTEVKNEDPCISSEINKEGELTPWSSSM